MGVHRCPSKFRNRPAIIFLDELIRNVSVTYSDVFSVMEWGLQVEVGDVKGAVFGIFVGKDVVDQ